jgi:hypothetical protein
MVAEFTVAGSTPSLTSAGTTLALYSAELISSDSGWAGGAYRHALDCRTGNLDPLDVLLSHDRQGSNAQAGHEHQSH